MRTTTETRLFLTLTSCIALNSTATLSHYKHKKLLIFNARKIKNDKIKGLNVFSSRLCYSFKSV